MTERILGKDCETKGTDDVCSYCGSVLPDYCNKDDADARIARETPVVKPAAVSTNMDAPVQKPKR